MRAFLKACSATTLSYFGGDVKTKPFSRKVHIAAMFTICWFLKGTLLGVPNREPQEYSTNIIGIYLPGSLYSIIFLLHSWGSLFGVPIRTLQVLITKYVTETGRTMVLLAPKTGFLLRTFNEWVYRVNGVFRVWGLKLPYGVSIGKN